MSETKHTPGPWTVHKDGNGLLILSANREAIAEVFAVGSTLDTETPRANARLIAAAPELLAALEDCIESLRRSPNTEGAYRVTCLSQALAAVAKAKGQP